MNHSTLRKGMLHTAAEGGNPDQGRQRGTRVSGRVTWGLGKRGEGVVEERGGG